MLSMIFFNVAFNAVIMKIKTVLPDCLMTAYCDDLSVSGEASNVRVNAEQTWQIIESFGFRINKSKCKFASPNDDSVILGMPIGSKQFVGKFISDLVEDIRLKTSRINTKNMAPKTRLIFLKICINTIPTYVIRLLSPSQCQYDAIDDVIDEGISQIIGRSIVNGYSQFIRGSPQELGGLGIHRYGTGFGQILRGVLRVRTNVFIQEHRLESHIPITTFQSNDMSLEALGLLTENDSATSSIRHGGILKNIITNNIMDTFHSDKHLANAALLVHPLKDQRLT